MRFFLTIALCLCSLLSQASTQRSSLSIESLRNLAREYYLQKETHAFSKVVGFQTQHSFGRRHCDDDRDSSRSSCIDSVCEKIGSYNCDSQAEISKVAMICANQDNADCIKTTCNNIGSYNCDSLDEIEKVGAVCTNIRDISCIDVVCKRIGAYNCDSLREIDEVGNVCSKIRDSSCIDTLCERIGSYNCDSVNEIKKVAETCKGH